jgi:AcrR family transcriptional regulator
MATPRPGRSLRADAQRNIDALVSAARDAFAESGPDASVREITRKAGVGVATFYRHFPERSDLITAVFRNDVDACADTATALAAAHQPLEALVRWLRNLTGFLGDKRGLASAVQSGNPAFGPLPTYFRQRFEPTLGSLLSAAAATGQIRDDVDPGELLGAMKRLCSAGDAEDNQRIVALLIDGLRYGADRETRSTQH